MQGFANQAHVCNHCMILSIGRYFCPTSQHIPILLQYICTQLTIHTHLVTVSESQGMTKCRRVGEGRAVAPPLLKACPQTPLLNLPPIFSTCSYPSEMLRPCRESRGKIHQAFWLSFCILQAIKNRSRGRPGNEASLYFAIQRI